MFLSWCLLLEYLPTFFIRELSFSKHVCDHVSDKITKPPNMKGRSPGGESSNHLGGFCLYRLINKEVNIMPKSSITIGDVFITNNCGFCTVIDYTNKESVTIKFDNTGFITKVRARNLKSGQVKDPYAISVCEVGFIGVGVPTTINGKLTRIYSLWVHMLTRCYSEKYHLDFPSYKGCSVAPRWCCFANFANDIKTLEGYEDWLDPHNKICLDKDAKDPGNKLYSIDTCRFITSYENIADASYRRSH
ncbi:hypothetical protein N5D18_05030 [Enterobacter hormaechei]|uniref:hypothetical protein n=1 Tax=Enterobacter hormaechei TaxID=158836 RepID=UPI0024482C24|nr:hypothetical protein [Enterobacter hormaechei]MDH0669782.1 hypothetical protein [Enterobacter hormaechei]MDH0714310.1 hypothetical protein [Enterobacter hormaechei]